MFPSSQTPHSKKPTLAIARGQIVRCLACGEAGLVVAGCAERVTIAQSGGWGITNEVECDRIDVVPYIVPKGTRAYEVVDRRFLAKGIIGGTGIDGAGATTYLLDDSGSARIVSESELLIRGETESTAGKLLAAGFWSKKEAFIERLYFLESFVEQIAAGGGIESFQASEYTPYPHQVAAVGRILQDPCPRFLLADEVGLGKTFEAGVVVRELLRRGEGKALIVVPAILLDQWRHELIDRLGIDGGRVDFRTLGEDIPNTRHSIVVMDEVHTITGDSGAMKSAEKVCGRSPAALLISATAAFDDIEVFLPLMSLLQPTLYPVADREGFEARMRRQTEISELLATFVPSISRRSIRNHLARICSLLADDERVRRQATILELLVSDDGYDEDEAGRAVESLRHYIVEGEKISRHVVRASRRLVALAFRYGRQPERSIVRIGAPLRREVLEALDEWRLTLSSATALANLTCASSLPEALHTAATARLESGEATLRELSSLKTILKLTRQMEGLETVASGISSALSAGETAVVFGSEPNVLAALGRSLRDLGLFVVALLQTEDKAAQRRAVLEFERNQAREPGTRRFVLLCDAAGQEGLNLQGADVLALLDLPWDVVALEQRIGRVDRLGRSRPLKIMVVEHGQEGSLHDAWLGVLERGFGLFDQSVSDVQPVLYQLTERFALAALSGEADGPEAYRKAVNEERRHQDVRRSLDGDEGREAEITRRTDMLAKAQADAPRFVKALLAFGANHGIEARPSFRGDFRLDVLPNAQIPQPWRGRLEASSGDVWTKQPRDGLPRLGFVHPMARELQRLALWDDEGQASASWRHLPRLPRSEEALFVKLQFLVGEDRLETKLIQIDGDGAKAIVRAQARREIEIRDYTLAWAQRGILERFVGVDVLERLCLKALKAANGAVLRAVHDKSARCIAAELIAVSGKELVRVP